MFVDCPCCHRRVLRPAFARHQRRHTSLRSDGQMHEHKTLPESTRYSGSLAGVPRTYRHGVCGGATGMPEEIIRSYLADPFLYSDSTFCTGCGTYVPHAEVTWVETGESLADYMSALRRRHHNPGPTRLSERP